MNEGFSPVAYTPKEVVGSDDEEEKEEEEDKQRTHTQAYSNQFDCEIVGTLQVKRKKKKTLKANEHKNERNSDIQNLS